MLILVEGGVGRKKPALPNIDVLTLFRVFSAATVANMQQSTHMVLPGVALAKTGTLSCDNGYENCGGMHYTHDPVLGWMLPENWLGEKMAVVILRVCLWRDGEVVRELYINAENRLDQSPLEPCDRLTIEPCDPKSRVQFTPDGGVFR
jgi:hypothetical protein